MKVVAESLLSDLFNISHTALLGSPYECLTYVLHAAVIILSLLYP